MLKIVPILALLGLFAGVLPENAACAESKKASVERTVYDRQNAVTEEELLRFLRILPQFRAWALAQHEEAHPSLTEGRPDFLYSSKTAAWIKQRGWDPRRFFCVMGKMAAALVILEEGNDLKGTRPPDMPPVTESERRLAHRHLAKLLQAGGETAPTVAVEPPTLPKKHER
ncbi:MAG: serine/threonine protein phosphatase [Desulfovibrio sp.]|nr:serine/threonine protein phosphatase [Desulfovibrio sp.]